MQFTLPRTPSRRLGAVLAATGAILALGACEDEATAPVDDLVEGQSTIDASSPLEFTYFSLTSGEVVDVQDPYTDTDWDIAFRRYAAKLNGGVAGGGDVAGYNVANNGNATETEVVAFSAADADAAFAAVTEADISGASFQVDGLVEDQGGSWFEPVFTPTGATLVANPASAWRVREADGGYALFRIVELTLNGQVPESAVVEFRHQDAGTNLGAPDSVTVDYTQGPNYVDLSTGTVVTPDACNWDVVLTPQFAIDFNVDCDAGTFPVDPTEDFTALTTADDAPEYGPFLSVISGAIPNTIDSANGIFWYNLEENQRMWPTLNVFLVRKGAAVYKVQVTDYYSNTGASGFPTVRYEQLR